MKTVITLSAVSLAVALSACSFDSSALDARLNAEDGGIDTAGDASGDVIGDVDGDAEIDVPGDTPRDVNPDATVGVCGDGDVEGQEACDDGNRVPNDYCPNDCSVQGACGDGIVQAGALEECDDGNIIGGDGCGVSCNVESVEGCGDGIVNGDELCDDSNTMNLDGCNAACVVEMGWTCPVEGASCNSLCGDNIVAAGAEECDDGNTATDACDYGVEACEVCGDRCTVTAGATSFCGDGRTDADNSELCDDGNNITDGCDYGLVSCEVCGDVCTRTDGVPQFCGDSVTQTDNGETCDDGNAITETCAFGEESCMVCNGFCEMVPGATAECGDGVVTDADGEECDDGDTETNQCDYGVASCEVCTSDCTLGSGVVSVCGDARVDEPNGEACDDGNAATEACDYGLTSCQVCDATCQTVAGPATFCGDGVVDASEECDDGNASGDDGCSNSCEALCPIGWEITYDLTGSFRIEVSGAFGGSDTQNKDIGPGFVTLRFADVGGAPGPGDVQLLAYSMAQVFNYEYDPGIDGNELTLGFNLAWNVARNECGAGTGVVGTGSNLNWDACGDSGDSSIWAGPGCMNGTTYAGNVACSDTFLGPKCGDAGLSEGDNAISWSYNQLMNRFEFNGPSFTSFTMNRVSTPNSGGSTTSFSLVGTEASRQRLVVPGCLCD